MSPLTDHARMTLCPRAVVTITRLEVGTRLAQLSCGHRVAFSRAIFHPSLAGRTIFCTLCERAYDAAKERTK